MNALFHNRIYYTNHLIPTACLCYPEGSRSEVCDRVSGQCKCRHDDITGRTCDTCAMDGYYGPVKGRCRQCKCMPANTLECVKVSAAVKYHVISQLCYRGLESVDVAVDGLVITVINVSLPLCIHIH